MLCLWHGEDHHFSDLITAGFFYNEKKKTEIDTLLMIKKKVKFEEGGVEHGVLRARTNNVKNLLSDIITLLISPNT